MNQRFHSRRGFTLIELLVVIAVIAILAVVVVLVLNPVNLIQQARDSNRLSDLNTITKALSVADTQGISSLGTPGVIYISIPDPTATTTAGTNCAGLGLQGNYHCPASSTYRNINGTGWLPVTLTGLAIDPPISSLPVDPVNTTSTGECYGYETDGTNWEIGAWPESSKYSPQAYSNFLAGTTRGLFSQDPCGAITYTTSTYTAPSLVRSATFDPHTNTIWAIGDGTVKVINDTTYASTTFAVAQASDAVFDPHTNKVWIATVNGAVEVNDTTYVTTTYAPTVSSWRIAFDSHTNTIWVPDQNNDTVTKIDDTSHATATYLLEAAGNYPDGIAFDSHTNTIWVANNDHTVTELNDSTFATTTHDLGMQTYGVLFDPHTNTVWVSGDGSMVGINDTTYVTTTVSGTEIENMAFDSHTNSIWVNGYTSQTVVQVNDTSYATTTYADPGFNIGGIAFDPHTNAIWTANGNNTTLTQYTPNR